MWECVVSDPRQICGSLSFSCIASKDVTVLSVQAGADESDKINIKAGRAAMLASELAIDTSEWHFVPSAMPKIF